MKKTTITLLMLQLLNISFAHGEEKKFNLQNQKFSLDVPSEWTIAENFMGAPLMFFGPEKEGESRSVITFTPTGKEDSNFVLKKMNKNIGEYKKGREEWLKDNLGESLSYDSYKEQKWNGIETAYTLGYHYELAGEKFYERSLYVLCGGNKLFHIKSLVPGNFETAHNNIVDKTIKSLNCEKTDLKTAKN